MSKKLKDAEEKEEDNDILDKKKQKESTENKEKIKKRSSSVEKNPILDENEEKQEDEDYVPALTKISEAEARKERERLREERQQSKTRKSLVNNRFLPKTTETNDTKEDKSVIKSSRDSPTKEDGEEEEERKNQSKSDKDALKNKTRKTIKSKYDDSNQKKDDKASSDSEEEDGDNDDDDDDTFKKKKNLQGDGELGKEEDEEEASLTITCRKSRRNSEPLMETVRRREKVIIDPPSSLYFTHHRLENSKWMEEIYQDMLSGLYTGETLKKLKQIQPNTLLCLQERLEREAQGNNRHHQKKGGHDGSVRIHDFLSSGSSTNGSRRTFYERPFVVHKYTPSNDQHHQLVGRGTDTAILQLLIGKVLFDDHVHFCLEDRVYGQIRSLYKSYVALLQQQKWTLLLERINSFLHASATTTTTTTTNTTTTTSTTTTSTVVEDTLLNEWQKQTIFDVENVLTQLNSVHTLYTQIVTKWHELQDIRKKEGRAQTGCQVKILSRAQPINLEDIDIFLSTQKSKYKKQMDHLNQRLEDILKSGGHFLRNVLKVDNSGDYVHSMKKKKGTSFFLSVHINGKQVARTKNQSWTSSGLFGIVDFQEIVHLKVAFFPDMVTVKLYQNGFFFQNVLLSSTSIPLIIPGSELKDSKPPAISLCPSDEWYQFSSTQLIPRPQWDASFLNSSFFVNFQRHTHGKVHIQVKWTPSNSSPTEESSTTTPSTSNCMENRMTIMSGGGHKATGICLPIFRPLDQRVNTTTSQQQQQQRLIGTKVRPFQQEEDNHRSMFSYERDFLQLIQDLPQGKVDPNDPMNHDLVRLQRHVDNMSTKLQERQVFRTLSLDAETIPTRRQGLTRRNQLLKARDQHLTKVASRIEGGLFEVPVPLNEVEITSNAHYLSVLRPEVNALDRQLKEKEAKETGTSIYSMERQRRLHLLKIHDFLERVKQNQLLAKRQAVVKEKTKNLASIIQEQPLPIFPGTIDFNSIMQFFSPRRRLRPQVMKRAAPSTVADWPSHCELYIQIQKAQNLPVRICSDLIGPQGDKSKPMGQSKRRKKTPGGRRKTKKPHKKNKENDEEDNNNDDDDDNDNEEEEDDEDDEEDEETNRRGRGRGRSSQKNEEEQQEEDESHIFVEIIFQGKKRRTTTSTVSILSSSSSGKGSSSSISGGGGPNAVWMETLVVPFRPPLDDWSPEALERIQDVVHINLFDQVVVNSTDEMTGVHEDHEKTNFHATYEENRFLGGIDIPFTTLYHNNGLIEATLRCDMPPVHLGYRNGHAESSKSLIRRNNQEDDEDDKSFKSLRHGKEEDNNNHIMDASSVIRQSKEATYLSLMLTLDPLLPAPINAYDDFIGIESEIGSDSENQALYKYAVKWMETLPKKNLMTKTLREFQVFVKSLSNGRQVFLTRFLRPQCPPAQCQTSIQKIVHFVKSIPFLDDWQLFEGENDLWSTSQEFLELNAGDYEEHAVLLCNFFAWFDRQESSRRHFLVIGRAVPEGKSVYVLRQDRDNLTKTSVLWNASTGIGYAVTDEKCPLLDVYLCVSSENIYANIQQVKNFHDLIWDIENSPRNWRPFFQAPMIRKDSFNLPSVQLQELVYTPTPEEYVHQVEIEIRDTLKLEIRRWRSTRFTTTFNMDVSMKLRSQLEELEKKALGEKNPVNSKSLEDIYKTKQVCGMPLNMTLTDLDKIIEQVKNTKLHLNERKQVEFGLAVYVCGYPNNILSVWIYFVSLVPK